MPKPVKSVENFYSMLQDFAIDNDLITRLKPVDEVEWNMLPPGGVSELEHDALTMIEHGQHSKYEEAISGEGSTMPASIFMDIKKEPRLKEVFFYGNN